MVASTGGPLSFWIVQAGIFYRRSDIRETVGLIVFFIAVSPANVRAARSGVALRGKPATGLWLRAPMQLLFIALAWWVSR
jgi:uncharacterized membrane protein